MSHAHRVLLAAAVLAACAAGAAAGALRGPPRTARAATPSSRRASAYVSQSGDDGTLGSLEDWEKEGPKCVQDLPFQLAKAPCTGTTGFANACFLESVSADVAAAKFGESLSQVEDAEACAGRVDWVCEMVGGIFKADACATDGPSCTVQKMDSHRYCWTDADCSPKRSDYCCKDEVPRMEAWADLVCDNVQLRGVELVAKMKEDGWCGETNCIADPPGHVMVVAAAEKIAAAVQYKSSAVALVLAAALSVLTICSV